MLPPTIQRQLVEIAKHAVIHIGQHYNEYLQKIKDMFK